ncbi:hypothetical protein D6858_07875 [Tsuneonella suprasediminis]|uniref:Uncharacterized protein n=1 Tax=Tsuneonella suprasediminis TaxID=2306996 RepID=A0A419R1X1_9SPHN|nr:hypothetical protein [Tsuneonella suprasediminis]RJX67872.1 hypothetical protein D6858_07875 [Tsuneonella suprasediminis]
MIRAATFALAAVAALGAAQPGSASEQGARDAATHNALYEDAKKLGLSPQSVSEMYECAAMWDRWIYIVESAADADFVQALHPELSVGNAKARRIKWTREARRFVDADHDEDYLAENKADAESEADRRYTRYANGEERGLKVMMEYLGICQ